MALTTYGNPLPSIIFNRSAAQPTITAAVTITASGSEFRFQSVDLYSSITTIPYVFTGRLKSNLVFSVSAEEGNTFGSFVTVANPNATDTIDNLVITLSNPETPCARIRWASTTSWWCISPERPALAQPDASNGEPGASRQRRGAPVPAHPYRASAASLRPCSLPEIRICKLTLRLSRGRAKRGGNRKRDGYGRRLPMLVRGVSVGQDT